MPHGRKPGERAAGVPRQPHVPLTPEQKAARKVRTPEELKVVRESREARRRIREGNQGAEVHVPKIMSPDPGIFPPKLKLACNYYLDALPRNPGIAAERAGMDPAEFKAYLHTPGVRQWLREQEELIDEKAAELRAKARVLTEDHLDAQTVKVLEDEATPPNAKVRMIEVGYRRFGMLKDKSELSAPGGQPFAFQIVRMGGKKEHDATGNDSPL